jgi:hypothetical protein
MMKLLAGKRTEICRNLTLLEGPQVNQLLAKDNTKQADGPPTARSNNDNGE